MIPFVFGHGAWCQAWAAAAGGVVVDVLAPASVSFFKLMNAANAKAFGDMGMPAWVQLDCATLPTAMVGYARKKRDVDAVLMSDLERRAGVVVDDDALVPLAEYCALPTPEAGHVVGFSLFSLVAGYGVRAKALGLLVMGARVQTGVTQVDNTALKTHARFGPLTIVAREVAVHSKPTTTIVYRLQVPPQQTLRALADGAITRVPYEGATRVKADVDVGDVVVDVAANGFVCS